MAGHSVSHKHLIIILVTTIPGVLLIVVGLFLYRFWRRRKAPFPSRGITPIGDEEIESWKVDKTKSAEEKETQPPMSDSKSSHQSNTSVGSVHKPPSLIIYQNHSGDSRVSDDQNSPWSPPASQRSLESPRTPVLARAPNSRPGLTDESVQGDEAFVSPTKRPPISRLSRLPAAVPRHSRTRSAWSSYGDPTRRDVWPQRTPEQNSPRPSWDTFSISSITPSSNRRATVSSPAGIHHDSPDEEVALGGLSPRPLISRSEIGRAIG